MLLRKITSEYENLGVLTSCVTCLEQNIKQFKNVTLPDECWDRPFAATQPHISMLVWPVTAKIPAAWWWSCWCLHDKTSASFSGEMQSHSAFKMKLIVKYFTFTVVEKLKAQFIMCSGVCVSKWAVIKTGTAGAQLMTGQLVLSGQMEGWKSSSDVTYSSSCPTDLLSLSLAAFVSHLSLMFERKTSFTRTQQFVLEFLMNMLFM